MASLLNDPTKHFWTFWCSIRHLESKITRVAFERAAEKRVHTCSQKDFDQPNWWIQYYERSCKAYKLVRRDIPLRATFNSFAQLLNLRMVTCHNCHVLLKTVLVKIVDNNNTHGTGIWAMLGLVDCSKRRGKKRDQNLKHPIMITPWRFFWVGKNTCTIPKKISNIWESPYNGSGALPLEISYHFLLKLEKFMFGRDTKSKCPALVGLKHLLPLSHLRKSPSTWLEELAWIGIIFQQSTAEVRKL